MIAPGDSLWGLVVRRIRGCQTIFGNNVKLSLRSIEEDQLSRLPLPHALVVPSVERPSGTPPKNELPSAILPRGATIYAQFDPRGSDQEYLAAADIELARYQLLDCLVNWKPAVNFDPTTFGGLRVLAIKAPQVRASFSFNFFECLEFTCDEEVVGCPTEPFEMWPVIVRPIDECPPVECAPC